jgi:GAF domain-containing protein
MGEVVQTGRPWQAPDVGRRGWLQPDSPVADLHGCLVVPLIARGRPLGGLALFSKHIRTFDHEDVELAQAFADQAALALQNADRLARERRPGRLERQLQRPGGLSPRDRQHVEQLLEAAERIVELGTESHVRAARPPLDHDAQT